MAPYSLNREPAEAGSGTDIVLFTYDFARTGVVVNAVRLANALAARGHCVSLLVCREDGRGGHRIDPAVKVVVARGWFCRWTLGRQLSLVLSLAELRRSLRRLAPAILLSAGNHGHSVATAASLGLPGLRRILRISNELHRAEGPLPVRLWRRLLHRVVIGRADRLLLVSAHLARHPLLAQALASGKAVVTPNGVDMQEVARMAGEPCAHPWFGSAEPVIVTVGRLVPHKNLATLIRALARVRATRPARLVIVGGGSAAERERLHKLAGRHGVGEYLQFTGEQANPMPFVARADVFVLPSLREGSSNALLEALACGVSIIAATSAGNAQEVLGYGRYGLLVDPMDVEGMAQAILYQTAVDACRPGGRAADFAVTSMIARACMAVTGLSSTAFPPPDLTFARRT